MFLVLNIMMLLLIYTGLWKIWDNIHAMTYKQDERSCSVILLWIVVLHRKSMLEKTYSSINLSQVGAQNGSGQWVDCGVVDFLPELGPGWVGVYYIKEWQDGEVKGATMAGGHRDQMAK